MVVVDTSAVVDYLTGGDWATTLLASEPALHAPHVVDVEVLGVLRRLARTGELTTKRASDALDDFMQLRIERYAHVPLLATMWKLRENVAPRDGAFVALAELLDADLVTRDKRLARAVGRRVRVVTP